MSVDAGRPKLLKLIDAFSVNFMWAYETNVILLITSQTSFIWPFPVCCHVCAIKSTPSQLKDVRP